MVRITQLGGGNALRVDDIASDASPFVVTGIGSVGIGTTNTKYALVVDSLVSTGPTALFVHGDAQITGDLIVDDFSLDELDVDQINVTGILTSAQTKLNGITTAVNINVTGISTFEGNVNITTDEDLILQDENRIIFTNGFSSSEKDSIYWGDTGQYLKIYNDTTRSHIVSGTNYGLIIK